MQIDPDILAVQPFLSGMCRPHLELLAQSSMLAQFRTDETIISEGAIANRFYLILEGRVDVEAPRQDGEALTIQTLVKGDVLGWSWLFPPYNWLFSARAVVPTKAIFFYATPLRELCEKNPDLGYELMKRVSEIAVKRLQATRHQLVDHTRKLPVPL